MTRLCHCAMVAALAWYLMAPPDLPHTSWRCTFSRGSQYLQDQCVDVPDVTAPLSKWHDVSYERLADCEADRPRDYDRAQRDLALLLRRPNRPGAAPINARADDRRYANWAPDGIGRPGKSSARRSAQLSSKSGITSMTSATRSKCNARAALLDIFGELSR